MISSSFRALCDAARSAHASHPALAEFCAFPDDLTGTPPERHFIKGASLMENDPVMLGSTDALVQAFLHASPDAKWRETCKGTVIGDDFMDRFAYYCLIGAGGPIAARHSAVMWLICHPVYGIRAIITRPKSYIWS